MAGERPLSRGRIARFATGRLGARGLGLALALALALAAPEAARGQEGVPVLSGAEEIELSGRVQIQALTSSCSGEAPGADSPCAEVAPGVDWFARRIRMALDVTVNDFISGEIQPDFGEVSGVALKNAYGRLTFGPAAKLQIGQFKKPFDGFHLTSSTRILTIERDLDVPGVPGARALSLAELTTRNLLSSYDLGAMLFGDAGGGIRYSVGVFDGRPPEANGDVNTEKQFVGRLEYSLRAAGMPLSLAVAGALTDLPYTAAGGRPAGQYYGDVELFAELGEFGTAGPHVQAGYVAGDNALRAPDGSTPTPPDAELATMHGWQVIGSWRLPVEGTPHVEAVEPVLRVTGSDPNADAAGDAVYGFTPGVQVFFAGRNKVAVNWDLVTFADDGTSSASSLKVQYQFHF